MRSVAICAAFLGSMLAACDNGTDGRVGSNRANVEGTGLPCDVDAIFARSCRGCHASPPLFGAPMSLGTYADLHAASPSQPSKKVYERVKERVHADTRPMPPPPNARLTSEQLAVLDRWIASGGPRASSACGAHDGGVLAPTPLSCSADVHVAPSSPWTMPETTDDIYVCYGFDVTRTEKRHVIGIAPNVDNPAIVHHLLLFQSDEAVSPIPTPCSGNSSRWRIVYAWAPGGGNFELPQEAGFPQEATTHYVMQIHYNNALHRPAQRDASGVDFCTTKRLRPNDADTMAFGSTNFQIAPRSTTDITCDTKMPPTLPTLHLFAAFPHMHQLGTSISTAKVNRGGGPGEPLGGQSSWDFQNQAYQPIDATITGGDTIRTRCAWKNPSDRTVTYGEGTEDEMCYSFTTYWPRVTNVEWYWSSPAEASRCTPTP